MSLYLSQSFSENGKTLNAFIVSLNSETLPEYLVDIIEDVFKTLSVVMNDTNQVLYIRDIKSLAINGIYPGGYCYNRHEAMIAVPSWKVDKKQLQASIAHELHHMARWQNIGYGDTLGGAIISEGIATYYEKLITGWISPWSKTELNESMILAAQKEWNSKTYNHSEWFFEGNLGRWVGYSIGCIIAEELYKSKFSLLDSVKIQPKDAEPIIDRLLHTFKT